MFRVRKSNLNSYKRKKKTLIKENLNYSDMAKTLRTRKINLIIFKRTLLTCLVLLEPSHKTGLIYKIAFQRIRLSCGFLWGSRVVKVLLGIILNHSIK